MTASSSALLEAGCSQAMWTILSVVEDLHLKNRAIKPLSDEELPIFVDNLMNSATHPLRSCLRHGAGGMDGRGKDKPVEKSLIERHYQDASDWLRDADGYRIFCAIFPLWHRGKVELSVEGKRLRAPGLPTQEPEYEAYNRLVHKDALRGDAVVDLSVLQDLIAPHIRVAKKSFELYYEPRLAKALQDHTRHHNQNRYALPDDWRFGAFTIGDFKSIFHTVQGLLQGWFLARLAVAANGLPEMGYISAVWTPRKEELGRRLQRYTGLSPQTIDAVLSYLTFGAHGIRDPDIAIQPLVELAGGFYALSPFIWLHADAERNLCVLLNQLPEFRVTYAGLTHQKEELLRQSLIRELAGLGFDFRYGFLDDTDVDLAIIDHESKNCLCVELKWFIEPAEVREIEQRSAELRKGVTQAKRISDAHSAAQANEAAGVSHPTHTRLHSLLRISGQYDLLAVVGSHSWIGFSDVQDPLVPIIKVWQIVLHLREGRSLARTLAWLRQRNYLPIQDEHFLVGSTQIHCGEWEANWYGIGPVNSSTQPPISALI